MAGSADIIGRQNYILGIGHPKSTPTNESSPVTVQTNPINGGSALSANGLNYAIDITPLTNTSAGIQAAIDAVAAAGVVGVVRLQPVVYTFTSKVVLRPGVSLIGSEPRMSVTTQVPEITWNFSNGTILQGDGTFDLLTYNDTDIGSPIAQFSSDALYGVVLEGFAMRNATRGIKIGAVNRAGLMLSAIRGVYYIDCTIAGIELHNFLYCEFKRIYGRERNNVQSVGMWFRSTVSNAVLICGNSTFENIFHYAAFRISRGIVFQQAQGCQLNEMNIIRAQVNKNGEAKTTQSATFTNASANIGVTDSTAFPVGMPVNFTASGNGFTAQQTYYVLTSSANVITLGNTPSGSSAITSSGTTGLTIETGGFPNMEVISFSGEYMNNSRFMGLDMESINSISFSGGGLNGFVVDMQETSAGSQQHVVLRAATDTTVHAVKGSVKTDFDNSAAGVRYWGGATRTVLGQPGHGYWNSKWQSGGSPSIVAGAAAGTGPTVSISYGTNDYGSISITTGTTPTTGTLATITATTLAGFAQYCPTLTPSNAAANALSGAAKVRVQQTTRNTGFDLVVDTALAASTQYTFNFRL